jgi:hypothetical protein
MFTLSSLPTDNAPDAQNELLKTFTGFVALLLASDDESIKALVIENGVQRRGTFMGDPYHIANLAHQTLPRFSRLAIPRISM